MNDKTTNGTAPRPKVDANQLDAKTKYDLLLYDFIQDDVRKNPWSTRVEKGELSNVCDGGFVEYCMLAHTNLYHITVIKRKPSWLPDNNLFLPAQYTSVVMDKHYFPLERPDEIGSRMLYQLFDNWKQK